MTSLTSDGLTRLAAFVTAVEDLSQEHGVELAGHMGTGIIIDGQAVYGLELANRSTTDDVGVRKVAYMIVQS